MFICRRNDQLAGIKTVLARQPGAVAVAGDDPKKYAAVVQEYSKV